MDDDVNDDDDEVKPRREEQEHDAQEEREREEKKRISLYYLSLFTQLFSLFAVLTEVLCVSCVFFFCKKCYPK